MSAELPRVKSVMTPFPYLIELDASLGRARRMMEEHGIAHLPVLTSSADGRRLFGVVTEQDLEGLPDRARIGEAECSSAYVVDMETPVELVARALAEEETDCVVVTKADHVAGIFTSTDACRVLADLLEKRREGGGNDAA